MRLGGWDHGGEEREEEEEREVVDEATVLQLTSLDLHMDLGF